MKQTSSLEKKGHSFTFLCVRTHCNSSKGHWFYGGTHWVPNGPLLLNTPHLSSYHSCSCSSPSPSVSSLFCLAGSQVSTSTLFPHIAKYLRVFPCSSNFLFKVCCLENMLYVKYMGKGPKEVINK